MFGQGNDSLHIFLSGAFFGNDISDKQSQFPLDIFVPVGELIVQVTNR